MKYEGTYLSYGKLKIRVCMNLETRKAWQRKTVELSREQFYDVPTRAKESVDTQARKIEEKNLKLSCIKT